MIYLANSFASVSVDCPNNALSPDINEDISSDAGYAAAGFPNKIFPPEVSVEPKILVFGELNSFLDWSVSASILENKLSVGGATNKLDCVELDSIAPKKGEGPEGLLLKIGGVPGVTSATALDPKSSPDSLGGAENMFEEPEEVNNPAPSD